MKEVEISKRGYHIHEVIVDTPNKVLTWTFSTRRKNIAFGLFRRRFPNEPLTPNPMVTMKSAISTLDAVSMALQDQPQQISQPSHQPSQHYNTPSLSTRRSSGLSSAANQSPLLPPSAFSQLPPPLPSSGGLAPSSTTGAAAAASASASFPIHHQHQHHQHHHQQSLKVSTGLNSASKEFSSSFSASASASATSGAAVSGQLGFPVGDFPASSAPASVRSIPAPQSQRGGATAVGSSSGNMGRVPSAPMRKMTSYSGPSSPTMKPTADMSNTGGANATGSHHSLQSDLHSTHSINDLSTVVISKPSSTGALAQGTGHGLGPGGASLLEKHHSSSSIGTAPGTPVLHGRGMSVKLLGAYIDADLVPIIPIERYQTDNTAVRGMHKIERPGTYVLLFDNTFSRSTSKRLVFQVEVRDALPGEIEAKPDMAGWLLKKKRKKMQGWAKRWFQLENGELLYSMFPNSGTRGSVDLRTASVIFAEGPEILTIDSGNDLFHMKAIRGESIRPWLGKIRAFKSQIAELNKSRHSLDKFGSLRGMRNMSVTSSISSSDGTEQTGNSSVSTHLQQLPTDNIAQERDFLLDIINLESKWAEKLKAIETELERTGAELKVTKVDSPSERRSSIRLERKDTMKHILGGGGQSGAIVGRLDVVHANLAGAVAQLRKEEEMRRELLQKELAKRQELQHLIEKLAEENLELCERLRVQPLEATAATMVTLIGRRSDLQLGPSSSASTHSQHQEEVFYDAEDVIIQHEEEDLEDDDDDDGPEIVGHSSEDEFEMDDDGSDNDIGGRVAYSRRNSVVSGTSSSQRIFKPTMRSKSASSTANLAVQESIVEVSATALQTSSSPIAANANAIASSSSSSSATASSSSAAAAAAAPSKETTSSSNSRAAGASAPSSPPSGPTAVRKPIRRRNFLPAVASTDEVSIYSILRKNLGKDLSRISMPVAMNEPLNLLQRLCEELEYSELLDRAAEQADPIDRITFVAAFAVSGYANTLNRAVRKPFNPMMGETYECVREDKGFRFVSEKVSHDPAIMACHAESSNFVFWQDLTSKSKFWGKSMEFIPSGTVQVMLLPQKEEYSWQKVTTCVRNIMSGEKWLEHYGDMRILCKSNGYSCVVSFKESSMFSNVRNEVSGVIMDEQGRRVRTLGGKWSEAVHYEVDKNTLNVIWRAHLPLPNQAQQYGFTQFAIELNELTEDLLEDKLLPVTDTRFRPDQRLLEEGKTDEADVVKTRLEEAQRAGRKQREAEGLSPFRPPAWFEKVATGELTPEGNQEESWRYKGGYWECRANKSWAALPTLW